MSSRPGAASRANHGRRPESTTSSTERAPVSSNKILLHMGPSVLKPSSCRGFLCSEDPCCIFCAETELFCFCEDGGRGTGGCSECEGPFAAGFPETGLASAITLLPLLV